MPCRFSHRHRRKGKFLFAIDPAASRRIKGQVCLAMVLLLAGAPDSFSQKNDSDFDGDGRTDHTVYHASSGNWYIRQSASLQPRLVQFGCNQSEPVPGEFDCDGKADRCVFSARLGTLHLHRSSDGRVGTRKRIHYDPIGRTKLTDEEVRERFGEGSFILVGPRMPHVPTADNAVHDIPWVCHF